MKELVYHRLLLPVAEQHADEGGDDRWGFTATFARARRANAAARQRAARRARSRQGRPLRGDGVNSHAYLELYHAAFLGGGVINPLNLRLAPKELEFIAQDSARGSCFVDRSSPRSSTASAPQTSIEHVVLIGDGDVPHDITYDDLLDPGTPVPPRSPTRTTSSS